ncbi:metal-dependent hydrolase, beta-lactamase superfamily III [Thermanaerovibrio velox DSM 12556]|uniref:Metal-dependent hydrolase, beta-lactamase superfamily III n=2 Tax=Thermanaerovibrio TaxID=81461 RepID=H0UR82_9BACT|nr:metal-dependent hydrolase, beta-lactamase superfamily III [Thermanaerovibrio velox DSM 12556]
MKTSTSGMYPENFIRFLGTSGARFCTMHQIRSSGGIFFRYAGFTGVIDPGPGCLHHMCRAVPELDPTELDGVLITHRHLDHCGDANAVVEAMVGGGYSCRGSLFLPSDALGDEPVIFRYLMKKVRQKILLEDLSDYPLGESATLRAFKLKHHGVMTFGFLLRGSGLPSVGVVSDTAMLPVVYQVAEASQVLIINVTLERRRPNLEHLSLEDVEELLRASNVPLVLVTHMGRGIIKRGPHLVEEYFKDRFPHSRVVCADDGMVVDLAIRRVTMLDELSPREGSHSMNHLKEDLMGSPLVDGFEGHKNRP